MDDCVDSGKDELWNILGKTELYKYIDLIYHNQKSKISIIFLKRINIQTKCYTKKF